MVVLVDITSQKRKTTIPIWNCGNNDEREKYIPSRPYVNERQEPDYLSGVYVDLPPKKALQEST